MNDYSIGVIGSHSGEEVGMAAKSANLNCIVVCQKGRDALYTKYSSFLFTDHMILDSFSDLIKPKNIDKLVEKNVIWFPNRSFSVYVDLEAIEDKKLNLICLINQKYIVKAITVPKMER